jgi:hypothetical protein
MHRAAACLGQSWPSLSGEVLVVVPERGEQRTRHGRRSADESPPIIFRISCSTSKSVSAWAALVNAKSNPNQIPI